MGMKTGDRVVCIKSSNYKNTWPDIIKGKIYTIRLVNYCGCSVWLDVGIDMCQIDSSCHRCRFSLPGGCAWYGSLLFRPLQFNSAHEELINIIEEKIDVEIHEPVL